MEYEYPDNHGYPTVADHINRLDANYRATEDYERDDRDPTYWRTNQTELANELNQHGPDCRCARCVGGEDDPVLKPLYDKIRELEQENARLREALRQLRGPLLERTVEEACHE